MIPSLRWASKKRLLYCWRWFHYEESKLIQRWLLVGASILHFQPKKRLEMQERENCRKTKEINSQVTFFKHNYEIKLQTELLLFSFVFVTPCICIILKMTLLSKTKFSGFGFGKSSENIQWQFSCFMILYLKS